MSGCIAQDSEKGDDEAVKFRTLKNGNVIAIKDGMIVGGAGSSVGPDKLPTFEFFSSDEKRKNLGFTRKVKDYATIYLKPVIEALRYPKGMPSDCEKIQMEDRQIKELANHMNNDKAKVLPYLAEVYRKGTFRTEPDYKHPESFESVIYTTSRIDIGEEVFDVEVVSKKRKPGQLGEKFIQYGISKADPAQDAILKGCYVFCDVNIK